MPWHRFIVFSRFSLVALLLMTVFLSARSVSAATIFFKPSTATAKVGGTFTVKVLVNTQSKTINNGEATISFPKDLVDVVSVSSGNSIFSLWVEQPNFSNSSGRLSFSGGLPNPGYIGTGGEIISVTFKAKAPGIAIFSFSGAAIRENDGLGTDILTGQGTASITITGAAVPKPEVATPRALVEPEAKPELKPETLADTIAPTDVTFEITSTPSGVLVDVSARDENLDHFLISVDDNADADTLVPVPVTQPVLLTGLTPGYHIIKVSAYDKSGNQTTVSRVVKTGLAISEPSAAVSTAEAPVVTSVLPLAIPWQLILVILGSSAVIFIIFLGWFKFFTANRKLIIAESHARQAFMMLLDQAEQQVGLLNKAATRRKLNKAEIATGNKLMKTIAKEKEMKNEE